MKKLTVNDATKDELIQYFFQPEGFGGGYRVPAMVDKFLVWLKHKRNGDLLNATEASIDESQKALSDYVDLVKQMNDEPDLDKKLEIAERANKAYERYEKAEKRYASLDKKLMDNLMDWRQPNDKRNLQDLRTLQTDIQRRSLRD